MLVLFPDPLVKQSSIMLLEQTRGRKRERANKQEKTEKEIIIVRVLIPRSVGSKKKVFKFPTNLGLRITF